MPAKVQTIQLGPEDRKLLRELVKWVRFFPLMYLSLWAVMCIILFLLIWIIFGMR